MMSKKQLNNPEENGPENAAVSTPAEDGSPSARRRRLAAIGLPVAGVVAVAALIAAVVFAGIFGYRWYDDAVNKQPVQSARDDALGGAEQAMLNVLNIDLKDSKGYESRLQNSVTGNARTQLLGSTGLGQLQKQAGDPAQAATLTAKLLRSAMVELNTDDNNAKTLVFIAVTSSRPNQASSSQTMGFQVEVTKEGGIWKASNIQPLDAVAIDSTDPAVTGAAPAASGAPAPATSAAPAPTPSAAPAPAPATGGN